MRIKLFESWIKRFPKNVYHVDILNKKSAFKSEEWNQIELNFFKKLKIENEPLLINFSLDGDSLYIEMMSTQEIEDIIDISKLSDEWYTIECRSFDSSNNVGDITKYYICDEWEEVEGFLGRETILKF